METCFLNHVLSFSLVVAFLVVPSTLEARTYTTTDKGAEGITLTGGSYSTGSGTQEQEGDTAQSLKTAASSAPAVTRSMHTETSTLHRRSGWRQTAGNFDTEQTEASTVTGRNLLDESTLDSTELPRSTELTEATAVPSLTDWEDLPTPGQLWDISSPSTLSLKSAPWTATEGRGSPSLRPGPESSQGWALAETTPLGAPEHTDSTYISTTLSRAGERTLLSVTSTSSSSSSSLSSSSSSSSSLSSSSSSSSSSSLSSSSSSSSSSSLSSSSSSSSSLSSSSSSSFSSSLSSSSSSSSSSSAFSNSSSTSGFTETGSYGSERSLSTQALGDIVSTEVSTGKAPSTRADNRDSTVKVVLHHHTSSQREEHYGTGSLEPLRVTEPLTEPPNPTHHQHQPSSISKETSSSAPPHSQTGTDVYGTSATERPERVSAVVSPSEAGDSEASSPGSKSSWTETERGGDSGFSSSATSVDVSTDNRSQTGVVSQTAEDQSTALGLTTAPPTVGASTTAQDDSSTRFLSRQSPFTTRTDGASIGVEVFTTMPTFVTHRSQVTTREEDVTRKPIASTAIPTQVPSRSPSLPPQPTLPPQPSSSSSSSSTLNDRDVTPTQGIPTQQSATAAAPRASTPPAEPSSVAAPSSPRQPPSPGWTQSSPTVETTHNPTVVTPPSVLLTPATTPARLGTTTTAPTTTTTTSSTTTTTTTSTVQSSSRTTAPQARSPPPPLAGSTPPPAPPAPPQTTALWKPGTSKATTAEVTSTVTTVTTEMASPPKRLPGNPCAPNPCRNGGMCESYGRQEFTCRCLEAWTGPNCTQDVDECKRSSCPAGSLCVNTRGSFSCECPLGFDLEDGRACTRAKTFLGTFSITRLSPDPVLSRSALAYETHRDIVQLLNVSLSLLRGYSRSTLSNRKEDGLHILAVHMFSLSANVTSDEVYNSVQTSLTNCSSTSAHCGVLLHHQLTYHVESLCLAQNIQCDTERSSCMDGSGTALCQCVPGYYKHNPDDLSCIECGDGYKLENGTCVQCMFGFGGFNCSNFYKLIAIVVSPAGGALLLILIIALIFTCCKKDKNDINKIIFKSGDLSPFTDFPKGNRVSMEWGRETIEMQENGSTKNLLQMTDIYYSPALRNADLERNGLYPFTGLPGSRHSCIYPSQWNPSFISDDSRRRDYF